MFVINTEIPLFVLLDLRGEVERYYAPNLEKVDGAYCFWSVR